MLKQTHKLANRKKYAKIDAFAINMAGNVDMGNRKVMQIESSRDLPNMIYGIRQNVNRQVSFHELYFFHSITALYIQSGEYNSI